MTPLVHLGRHGRRRARRPSAAGARPVAGGTDLVVGARQGKAPLPDAIVAIDRIDGLRAIDASRRRAPARHARDPRRPRGERRSIRTRYTALADASAIVGSHATRAQGTIGGNVMNASPAMDTGGPLLCFDATATLRSASGERSLALDELWTGPGTTSARPDELLVALDVPAPCRRNRLVLRAPRVPPADGDRGRRRDRRRDGGRRPDHRRPRRDHGAHADDPARPRGGVRADRHRRRRRQRSRPPRPRPRAASTPISDVRGSADYRRAMAEVIATPRDHRRAHPGARRAASRSPRVPRCTARVEEPNDEGRCDPPRERHRLSGRARSRTSAC